jgi:protein phosphatase
MVRGNNEDNYAVDGRINRTSADRTRELIQSPSRSWHIAGIFDGMCGGEAGELASKHTAELFQEIFSGLRPDSQKSDLDRAVRTAFLKANNTIVDMQQTCQVYGTTGTVLCTDTREFKLYHLGDSRAYLFRGGELFQLTKDQTLAQLKLETGFYDRDDPRFEADKHKLTEYIGRDWTKTHLKPVEHLWNPVLPGDRVLLCSDGLYDFCTDAEISGILSGGNSMEEQTARLIRTANEKGGEDNITCILIAFE